MSDFCYGDSRQFWKCLRCNDERAWGDAPYDKRLYENGWYKPMLKCDDCKRTTRHEFSRGVRALILEEWQSAN